MRRMIAESSTNTDEPGDPPTYRLKGKNKPETEMKKAQMEQAKADLKTAAEMAKVKYRESGSSPSKNEPCF